MERLPEMDELYSVILESSTSFFLYELLCAVCYHLYMSITGVGSHMQVCGPV